MSEERSLADVSATVEVEDDLTVDSSVTPTPEDFDLDSWIEGVRPTRKSIKLFPHANLIARMEQIADQIDNAPPGEDVDELISEFEQAKAEFKTGVWFTIEQRSQEWVDNFRKRKAKDLKITDEGSDAALISIYQMAEQIVQPADVTFNHLRTLQKSNEGEFAKLVDTLQKTNQVLAEKNGVLDRDFSERRSGTTPD